MNFSEDINIKKILFSKYHILGKLCYKSEQLNLINNLVINSLSEINPELSKYCIVANIDKNCLLIETAKSEFLTQLRFCSNEILSSLRQNPSLAQLITIKFRVNPELESLFDINYAKKKFKQNHEKLLGSKTSEQLTSDHPRLNQNAKNSLKSIADGIKNSKLKEAIEKLINIRK